MGLWSFYFLAKLYLFWRGFIRLHFVWNLLFLFFLLLPSPQRFRASRAFAAARSGVQVVWAILLLWGDSWLPPLWDAVAFAREEGMPSKEYLFRFILDLFNPREALVLVLLFALSMAARRRVRLTFVILVLLLIVPMGELGQRGGVAEGRLKGFLASESERVVPLGRGKRDSPTFDVILLHVCSLSWDDLRGIGLENDPFFGQFDVLFSRFNSVTAYSNPSAIRLLRADCGQTDHGALYRNASPECYLSDRLQALGYEPRFLMNHDGRYGRFGEEVARLGGLPPPILPAAFSPREVNFDGSPIFDDDAVLEKGWRTGSKKPAFIYYNTISLHDGAHRAGDRAWWRRDRTAQYKESVQKLFSDFTKFFDAVAASDRNAVIFFVPEHGMALRASTIQGPGLREIPLPQITAVPVGVKLIGRLRRPVSRGVISEPTSYLSLASLLSAFLERDPFRSEPPVLPDLAARIPKTEFVSENERFVMIQIGPGYYLKGKDAEWVPVPSNAIRERRG